MLIRPAVVGDLAAVADIYNVQVKHGIATFDTEPRTADFFAAKLAPPSGGGVFLVAVETGSGADTVLGYASSGEFRPRAAYAGTRETSVYVATGAAGRGIGRALMTELLQRLDAEGVHTVVAVIALPNDASVALHRSLGFAHIGTLAEVGRKFDRYIDTAWYQRISSQR